jgi:predicted MPP superfamily phosphohydrolase
LYVNRGFGFIGYPGRVGILPEVTLITLEQGEMEEIGEKVS